MGYYLASLCILLLSSWLTGVSIGLFLYVSRRTPGYLTFSDLNLFIALQPLLALLYLFRRRHCGVDNVLLVLDAYVFLTSLHLLCRSLTTLVCIAEEQGILDPKAPAYVDRRRGGPVTRDDPLSPVDEEHGISAVPELTVAGGADHAGDEKAAV